MLKRVVLIAAILAPQMAAAADLSPVRRYHHVRHTRMTRAVEQNKVFHCTTSDFVLFAYSNCGQGFDPMVFSAY